MTSSGPFARRASMPVRVFRLGQEPPEPAVRGTAEERLGMLVALTARMVELAGDTVPAYSRDEMPVRIIRPS